jgi:hypothetical protein
MDQTGTDNPINPGEGETIQEELSHSDKMMGVITEPSATFEKTSWFPPKTIDWFLPIFLLLLVVAVTNIVKMSNPEIKAAAQEKQMEQIRKNFDEMVAKGQISRQQADEQLAGIEENMEKMGGGIGMVISSVSIFIIGFIIFFIMTAIYYLFAKVIFKDNGTYASAMVANGLTAYIGIIQIIIAAILALVMGKMVNDTSAAALMDSDRSTFMGWILAKVDPFSIWAYIVLAIGLTKMFRSNSPVKYYGLVFGIWLIGGLIFFFIAQAVPFLRFFGM